MNRNFIAFISYRHMPLDAAVARELQQRIEQYVVPRPLRLNGWKRLGLVFRDKEELPATSDLSADIADALQNSRFLIVVCTPDTPESSWVRREIADFIAMHGRERVLAVLADGTPQEAFPPELTQLTDEDGNVIGEVEPLAANIVADTPSTRRRLLKEELIRLIAAILGCPYDMLVQRERKRQRRRRLAAASAALAVALTITGILAWKNAQLSAQNRLLLEQKHAIQLSESRLLTDSARNALAAGDSLTARRDAAAALPTGVDDDRPYYPQAEAVLLDAAQALVPEPDTRAFLASVTLAMDAPVADFAIGDGRLFAMDNYGTVRGFDPLTGETLWQRRLALNTTLMTRMSRLFVSDESGLVVAVSDKTIAALDQATGEVRWSILSNRPERPPALSRDGKRLVCVESELVLEDGAFVYHYAVTALSVETGETLCRCPIGSDSGITYINISRTGDEDAFWLSDDGSRAVGLYYESVGTTDVIHYYEADLTGGACREICAQTLEGTPTVVWLRPGKDGGLLSLRPGDGAGEALVLERFDDGGKEPAQRVATTLARLYFGRQVTLLSGGNLLLASMSDKLYAFDLSECAVLAEAQLSARAAAMFWVQGSVFATVLEDGDYQLRWLNENGGFGGSAHWNACFDLGRVSACRAADGGFLQVNVDGNNLVGFSMNPMGLYRYLAVVPGDDERAVRVRGIAPPGTAYVEQRFDFPSEGNSLTADKNGGVGRINPWGRMLLCERDYSGGDIQHLLAVLDPVGGKVISRATWNEYLNAEHWPLTDASAMVACSKNGDITLTSLSGGEARTLAESEEITLCVSNGTQYIGNATAAACAYRPDGRLVTVWCDGATLRWWLDGEAQPERTLPEGMLWRTRDLTMTYGQLVCGGNGWAVLSRFDSEADVNRLSGFAACELATGKWVALDDEARADTDRRLVLSETLPLMAALDADRQLRIYDLEKGALARRIDLDMPMDYVLDCRFALDDGTLLLRLEDNRLLALDAATGEVKLETTLERGYEGLLTAGMDPAGRRIYLIDNGSQQGLCLDAASWTVLGRIKDVVAYDPVRDRLCFFLYGDTLFTREMPSRETLVEEIKGAGLLMGNGEWEMGNE